MHKPGCLRGGSELLGQSLNVCSASRACRAAPLKGRRSLLCIAKGQSYHVEIACGEGEDVEGAFKRFRNTCNLSGMVYEARRRQYFENTQDIKKRKQQEKGLRKMRDQREKFLITFEEANTDTPPFTDLFQGDDDLYDFGGSTMSMDGDLSDILQDRPSYQQRRREAPPNGDALPEPKSAREASEQSFPRATPTQAAAQNGSVRRSIPSQSPAAVKVEEDKSKARAKPRVETSRMRREAKKQVPNSPISSAAAQGRQAPTGSGVGSKARKGRGGKGKGKAGAKVAVK